MTQPSNLKKSSGLLCKRVELRYDFIRQHKKAYPITVLFWVMEVSRRGYYKYLKTMYENKIDPDFKRTTDSNHKLPVAPNLLNRQFEAKRPDTVWCADITYLWTLQGWLYLSIRDETRNYVIKYLEMFYNSHRIHSFLGYKNPNIFENNFSLAKIA